MTSTSEPTVPLGAEKPACHYSLEFVLLGIGIILLGCFLRLLAARGDFWLDEVWTYTIVMKTDSVLDLLVNVKHDNNHFVNSPDTCGCWGKVGRISCIVSRQC